jgi:hypothetical protein
MMLLSFSALGQGLYKMGKGMPYEAVKAIGDGHVMYFAVVNDQRAYELVKWNGITWSSLGVIDALPLHGANPDGEFELTGLCLHNSVFYASGNYTINTSGTDANVVVRSVNGKWEDISNQQIQKSIELMDLVVFDDELLLVGKFRSSVSCNIMRWDDTAWSNLGDKLTKDLNNDFIRDLQVFDEKLYAVGRFSTAGLSSTYAIALFNGSTWEQMSLPPFLKECYGLSNWNNNLVYAGKPNVSDDYVKIKRESGWEILNGGLADFVVNEIYSIHSFEEQLYLLGSFKTKADQAITSCLIYQDGTWSASHWGDLGVDIALESSSQEVSLYGNFKLSDIEHAALIGTGVSTIHGYIYLDENLNCIKDVSEAGVPNVQLQFAKSGVRFYSDINGRFELPVSDGSHEIILGSDLRWEASCDDYRLKFDINGEGSLDVGNIGLKLQQEDVDLKLIQKAGWTIEPLSTTTFKLCANNIGSDVSKEGKIYLEIPTWVSSLSSDATFEKSGSVYTWALESLAVGTSFCIEIEIETKGQKGEDGVLKYYYKTTNGAKDIDPKNDGGEILFTLGSSADPIFKQLAETTITTEVEKLHYHIGVQNVSGKAVNDFWMRDTLDEDLYIYTVREFASFPSDLKIGYLPQGNGNYRYVYTWIAKEGFSLSDSSKDQDLSKAFVQLEIGLAKGFLDVGTSICNQAEVFFNNLEPLYTNEVCREVKSVGITGFDKELKKLQVYPNPTLNTLVIQNPYAIALEVSIYDVMGRAVVPNLALEAYCNQQIDFDLPSGFYFVQSPGFEAIKIRVQ